MRGLRLEYGTALTKRLSRDWNAIIYPVLYGRGRAAFSYMCMMPVAYAMQMRCIAHNMVR